MNANQTALKHANKLVHDCQHMDEQVFFDHYFKTFDVNIEATVFSDRINGWDFEIVLERSADYNVRFSSKDSIVEASSLDYKDGGMALLDRRVTQCIRDIFQEHLEDYLIQVCENIKTKRGD